MKADLPLHLRPITGSDLIPSRTELGPLPDPEAIRYRCYFIQPKRDFGNGPGYFIKGRYVKAGWIVTNGTCDIMPGAAWFETVEEAKYAVDVFIAVRGNGTMFWEIMHPFQFTVGEKHAHDTATIKHGRHYAIIRGGTVVETGIKNAGSEYRLECETALAEALNEMVAAAREVNRGREETIFNPAALEIAVAALEER